MKKTKYCESKKFPIGHNTGKFSKCFFLLNVFPAHQKCVLKKNNTSFLNLLLKDVFHAFDEENKILQGKNVSNWA